MKNRPLIGAAGLMLIAAAGCVQKEGGVRLQKKASARVALAYRIKPLKSPPAGLTRLGVFPIKTGGENEDEQKWSHAAARRLESKLQEIRDADSLNLEIVDQDAFRAVLEQKEAMQAGLVEGDQAIAAAKLKNVQAMITGAVAVRIDAQTTKKSSLDWSSFGGVSRYGGSPVRTKEVEGVCRTITMDVTFKLVDGATGESIDSLTKQYQETEKKEPSSVFGSGATEGDLAPRDAIISNMIDAAITEFLSRMFPYSFAGEVVIQSGKSPASVRGVLAAQADDYAAAAEQLKTAAAETPNDARTLFALGVVLEKLGQYDAALKYYRQASLEDPNRKIYEDCRIRLERFKDRLAAPPASRPAES